MPGAAGQDGYPGAGGGGRRSPYEAAEPTSPYQPIALPPGVSIPTAQPIGYGNNGTAYPPQPQQQQQSSYYDGSGEHVVLPQVLPTLSARERSMSVVIENTDYCSRACCGTFMRWLFLYIALIAVGVLLAVFVKPLGLLLLAILPACTLLTYLETRFRKSTIRMQMVLTFFEAVAWMVPIVILENLVNYFLIERTHLPKEGYCAKCILSDFLQAYLVAGLFEESVKYLAVRRIVWKPFVIDPRSLVVYSCCAGAAFGTVEDVMYNLSYGVVTAIVRAFTSVPLHCATGLIMGISLADTRFLEGNTERWYKTLILPVFIHGTYDFVTFLLSESDVLALVGFAVGCLIVLGSYLYIRRGVLVLLKTFPREEDVHSKIISGEIDAPGICCCNPAACPTCYL